MGFQHYIIMIIINIKIKAWSNVYNKYLIYLFKSNNVLSNCYSMNCYDMHLNVFTSMVKEYTYIIIVIVW